MLKLLYYLFVETRCINIFQLYVKLRIFNSVDTLMLFWPILGPILFLIAYIRPLGIILDKKTTELVLLFHKNITKLVFLWPNMSQKCFKVLNLKHKYNFRQGFRPYNFQPHITTIINLKKCHLIFI